MGVSRREAKGGEKLPLLRRPKGRPCDDFWHTIAIGAPITIILFLILPPLLN
jgi:hypothetical protein